MPYECPTCQSMFFKTLETRLNANKTAVLYKKRCKRCKHKWLLIKTALHAPLQATTAAEWQAGHSVKPMLSGACLHGRMTVGEFTRRTGQPADAVLPYLERLASAQQQPTL